jgi:hypothetical protein
MTKNANGLFTKSPFNYTGGKYKILSQIISLSPKNINCFVDLKRRIKYFCKQNNTE